MKNKKACKFASVGGQALIEGIMMNGPKGAAMSVRLPEGDIKTIEKKFTPARNKYKILGIPLLRGIVSFIESMVFGFKCLMESAELSGDLEKEDNTDGMSRFDKWLNNHLGPKLINVISAIGMFLGVALSIFLFFWLPIFLVDLVTGNSLESFHPTFEGIIRIIIFIAYIYLTSRLKDIKRVFMYHGAEHKTIFCYEAGKELTVENVRGFKRFHPRCGTSFIFVIMIISILISSSLVLVFPNLGDDRIIWMIIKLLIMPLVMGLGYEFIRFSGRHNNLFTKVFAAPGLWMQRLTTAEPPDDVIEVGIESLKAVIAKKDEDEKV